MMERIKNYLVTPSTSMSTESSYYPIGNERHQAPYGYGGEPRGYVDGKRDATFQPNAKAHLLPYGQAERPYGGQPWRTAPPMPDQCAQQVFGMNLPESAGFSAAHNKPYGGAGTPDRPYGERYAGVYGNYGPPPAAPEYPELDPARNPCHPGYSEYSKEDFRDVPVLFAQLMKHKYQLEPLAIAFASAENAYRLHRAVSDVVYEQYNQWIAKQDNFVLAMTMFKAYEGYRVRYKTGNLEEDVDYLNNLVLDVLVPRAQANLRVDIAYLTTNLRVAQPIPLPVNLSQKGQDGKSGYNLTRFLP